MIIQRRMSGLVEVVCEHGVGHPHPESVDNSQNSYWSIHGCDGCCGQEGFFEPLTDEMLEDIREVGS